MKVKTMKKALSVLCASAMVAGTFAVADMGTVEAAAPLASSTWSAKTYTDNGKQYVKVPYSDLVADADSYTTAEGNGQLDTSPAKFIDGDITTYYHSKYNGSGVGTNTNTSTNTANKLRLSFKNGKSCKVVGIAYLPRQNDSRPNGTFEKIQVAVKKGAETTFTTVNLKSGESANKSEVTFSYDAANWATNKNKESVILFEQPQEAKAIEIIVKQSQGSHMTAGEISVLTANEYSDQGAYTDIAGFTYTDGSRMAAPAPENKVFAGWLTEDGTKPLDTGVKTGAAKAKFMDAKVVDVKSQVIASTDSTSPSTTLRFVSTLDTNKYTEAGFYVTKGNVTKKFPVNKVFNKLTVVGATGEDTTLLPTHFSNESTCFVALNLNNIGSNLHKEQFKAQPYFVTYDGVEVKGNTVSRSVNDNLQNYYLSTLKSGPNFTTANNPNWVSVAEAKNANQLLNMTGGWNVYPNGGENNFNEFIFGKKLEIVDANGQAGFEYKFTGKGIVLFAHKVTQAGSFKVTIDNHDYTPNNLNCQGSDNYKTYLFSKTGLAENQEHTLKISGASGKVCLDSFYIIK